MKTITLLFLILFVHSCLLAQPNLDSLYAVWQDETQTDSARTEAFSVYIMEGFMYSDADTVFILAESLLNYAEEHQYENAKAKAYRLMGNSTFYTGDIPLSLDYYQRSLKLFEKCGDKRGTALVLNGFGAIYKAQGDYPKALDYFHRSLKIFEEIGDKLASAKLTANIGSIYNDQGDYSNALDNFKRSLKFFEEIGDAYNSAIVNSFIGGIYGEQKDYSKALDFFQSSLIILEETGNKYFSAQVRLNMGNIYYHQKAYSKTLESCKKALLIAQEINSLEQERLACEYLYETYKTMGKSNEALVYLEKLNVITDSLHAEETTKKLQQMEFEKVMLQDSIAKAEEARLVQEAHETEMQSQTKTRNIIIAVAVFFVLLAGGFYSRVLFIHKTNKELAEKNKIIAREKERAETSEKYKEQFLANMSHEIRTPMHAISGMIKILLRNEHPPAQDVYLNAMKTSSENLVVILNDVLDLSKIEAGKLEIEHIPMNPAFVIENVIQILKYKAEEKGLILSYKVANDVPSLVMGDPTRLNQILVNLCGNAIKFTEKGKVDISLHIENEQLHFQINDTGIGIPKSEQNIIFTAFKQAKESTARFYGGTGLGLSISKQLVELQHGRIWLESTEGTGSTFYVTFPLINAEAKAIVDGLYSEAELQSMATTLNGIHILIAEDNPFNQMIAQDDLSYFIEDITIDIVENGALAVEKFKSNHFDLILMDVQMPEMNGIEATGKIREIEKSGDRASAIPIIAMTASLLKTEIDNCLKSGMDDYIPKPYTTVELIAPIFKALRS